MNHGIKLSASWYLLLALLYSSCVSNQSVTEKYSYLVQKKPINDADGSELISELDILAANEGKPLNKEEIPLAPVASSTSKPVKTHTVIQQAKSYLGVPYKSGGTGKKGMDCSGLVYTSYKAVGTTLPRSSTQMAKTGKEVKKGQIKAGDLVFFQHGKGIDHVGLVVKTQGTEIEFIHATTSGGVRIDKLSDDHWKKRFVKATALQ